MTIPTNDQIRAAYSAFKCGMCGATWKKTPSWEFIDPHFSTGETIHVSHPPRAGAGKNCVYFSHSILIPSKEN